MALITAGDIVMRLIDFIGGDQGGGRNLSMARRALHDALRDWPQLHRWNWYKTLGRLNLYKSYSTGLVTYDASLFRVTLSGGTFPAWAGTAQVRVGNVVARVVSRDSNTQLTLDPSLTFSAAITTGAAYRVFLDRYQLPSNFSAILTPLREDWWGGLQYETASGYLWGNRGDDYTGVPRAFTILPDPYVVGRFCLLVTPYPDDDRTLDFVYLRTMRTVRYDVNTAAGTVTLTGAAVAGVGTAFKADMVGSVMRFGDDATSPELVPHLLPAHESKITAVASATAATVEDAVASPLVGVGYSISDPLEMDLTSMATAFQWLATRTLAAETGHKGFPKADEQYQGWLEKAKYSDSRFVGPDQAGAALTGRPYRWRGPTTTET